MTCFYLVPNEEAKGPGIKVYPQSITTSKDKSETFTLETEKAAKSGKFFY